MPFFILRSPLVFPRVSVAELVASSMHHISHIGVLNENVPEAAPVVVGTPCSRTTRKRIGLFALHCSRSQLTPPSCRGHLCGEKGVAELPREHLHVFALDVSSDDASVKTKLPTCRNNHSGTVPTLKSHDSLLYKRANKPFRKAAHT